MHATQAVTSPRPSWPVRILLMLGRTLLLTILFTALGMALGLMVGIVVTIFGAVMHSAHPDMRNAYLHFAFPTAITTGTCALLWNLFTGISRLRRG
jgi:ABC-type amino acid transport system permease subunit